MRGGDPASWCPALWRELLKEFSPETVMDVGCGEGHAVRWWRGINEILCRGIDGLPLNIDRGVTFLEDHDLTVAPYIWPCDLVWCCEVVEHIEEKHVDKVLDTLCNGSVVAMTHATPDQLGYHHVNCQPAEYWVSKMVARGYNHSVERSEKWRVVAEEGTYFRRTGLVFRRH